MHFFEKIVALTTSILNCVTLSPVHNEVEDQNPLLKPVLYIEDARPFHEHDRSRFKNKIKETASSSSLDITAPVINVGNGPDFYAPGAPDKEPFLCEYPAMVGWESCSTETDRKCWLRRKSDGKQFDINSDYENEMPIGIVRPYEVYLEDSWFAADGINFTSAKLFNNTYPGPWIQGCWGDRLEVKVINKLKHNGTSVHWHGIRQNQTMHMDGVNGVTQCPIAKDDYFLYNFTLTQYGSSWYHSHYSVQYADGALGPMTIHGPSSANWDEAISPPLIMTDWGHDSAFQAIYLGLSKKDILLNGRGNVTAYSGRKAETKIKDPYTMTFSQSKQGQACKKYLIRVINTSFLTTFMLSIDNHRMQIVSADFVPIQPYTSDSVLVGIGQRYNIIVEANPIQYNDSSPIQDDGNYWIRTWIPPNCGMKSGTEGYEKAGILRYDSSSTTAPTSEPWAGYPGECADEKYENLVPILPWKVAPPANAPSLENYGELFDLDLPYQKGGKKPYPLGAWSLATGKDAVPIRVNYSVPTFFELGAKGSWDPQARIVPENYTEKDWVYLVIKGNLESKTFGAHPIHLHGHDFALLQQSKKPFNSSNMDLKLRNPPRRDVVLLPNGGHVVIAFKADNPGAWLVHCHIAFHISEGLGMQILENQPAANHLWPHEGRGSEEIKEAQRVCKNWDAWYNNQTNWAVPPKNCTEKDVRMCFQDDSGV